LKHIQRLAIITPEQLQDIRTQRSVATEAATQPTAKPCQDDEWDPIGSDDELDDENSEKNRLALELFDAIYAYIDKAIGLIQNSRTTRLTSKSRPDAFDETDILSSYGHAINIHSSIHFEAQDYGLLGRSLHAILKHREASLAGDRSAKRLYALSNYHHVESSLAQLKRAGLGLLTSGLGKLGLGSPGSIAPHPADNDVIVIFVVGGISFEEIGQLKRILHAAVGLTTRGLKLYIAGNDIFLPNDIFEQLA
jgi:hypothetical protein